MVFCAVAGSFGRLFVLFLGRHNELHYIHTNYPIELFLLIALLLHFANLLFMRQNNPTGLFVCHLVSIPIN